MKKIILAACALEMLLPGAAAAQDEQAGRSSQAATSSVRTEQRNKSGGQTSSRITQKTETTKSPLRTRANIKIDVTISDQTGSGPVEKKVVSVIAAEETWGKIRTQAAARMSDGGFQHVGLNVDARPWLTSTGAIQLELTVAYNPPGATAKDTPQARPTELNQSMTIILQNGKPMLVSQAADPIMDRKIVVEVVAAILK